MFEDIVDRDLALMENGAVERLMQKTAPSIRNLIRQARLPENLAPDVLHDAVVILVKKIRDNVYNPAESAPATYLIAIAKNLIANHLRNCRAADTAALEETAEIPDDHTRDFLEGRERRELLESLLDTLGEPCAQLIRLKYLDGYRDEEILAQNLTHYTYAGRAVCHGTGQAVEGLNLSFQLSVFLHRQAAFNFFLKKTDLPSTFIGLLKIIWKTHPSLSTNYSIL